mmetsp:Transcript_23207/g.34057  ORF Transcript_23207/g.34057 Transcript_23207/m.34057 type:complete len:335 (+) Transcript_23207:3-1007(+)
MMLLSIASFILIAWIGISISILSNPVCDIYSSHDTYDNQDNSRIVAVGDIHGSFTEFMLILKKAGITDGETCRWLPQKYPTKLIQIGDVVDRGSGATEAWECLETLQLEAPSNANVIRLIGNHELMWLQGNFRDRSRADTKKKVEKLVGKMKSGIRSGTVIASHVERIHNIPLMFVHAGFRPEMIQYLKSHHGSDGSPESLSRTLNSIVKGTLQTQCLSDSSPCSLSDAVFGAGPDRGGMGIGGPFWTDYKVLAKAAAGGVPQDPYMMQIVGHTASPGSVRYAAHMTALCIDAAMMVGVVSYLEISVTGKFFIHMLNSRTSDWDTHDLTSKTCS